MDLDDIVYGVHAVEEALAAGDRLLHVCTSATSARGTPRCEGCSSGRAPSRFRSASRAVRISRSFPSSAHQSVVAFGEPYDYRALEEVLALPRSGRALFVMLDHLTDPHNVGAIIRSAECAGATALVLPDRRSAGVNGTVRKSAAGATAHLPIARVTNVAAAVRVFKKHDIWVAGAATGPDAQAYDRVDLDRDLAIVIGAEGDGIAPIVRKECDFLVSIPLHGEVESLNASVAAGILLFEAVRQMRQGGAP